MILWIIYNNKLTKTAKIDALNAWVGHLIIISLPQQLSQPLPFVSHHWSYAILLSLVTSNFNSSVMRPQDPNRTFYFLSDGPTPIYFAIMCQL